MNLVSKIYDSKWELKNIDLSILEDGIITIKTIVSNNKQLLASSSKEILKDTKNVILKSIYIKTKNSIIKISKLLSKSQIK